ncbi:cytochrome c-type biogenesis protein CcmH [Pseudidiomarina maritima]|uniref:Cytochrome c-type biogenesis protein n=1 Tax=Pseudidiomarina maritima TaxID=519453 RepID=A0A1I6GQ76_9GAMM|nr:cytochrome c-type biogenesis protein [Pseudidiomarina maritima]SFR44279.1 cytochrome c-type biogenesis protein CcmH [Pseudidiomarina maritima]
MIRSLITMLLVAIGVAVSSWSIAYAANLETYKFDDPKKEALFRELIDELRCPKCQNQTIGDSDAPLAKDLRDRTYMMIQQGASKQEVVDYMVARYGDFAYYRPPVKLSTVVLWLGPVVVILVGAGVILMRVRSRNNAEVELSEQEQAQLDTLRDSESSDSKQDKSS